MTYICLYKNYGLCTFNSFIEYLSIKLYLVESYSPIILFGITCVYITITLNRMQFNV